MAEEERDPSIQKELLRIEKMMTERYMTREEVSEKVRFPKNRPNKIVIKGNEKGTGFLRGQYRNDFLNGIISEEEFEVYID
jgi:hypothetical protein